MMINLIKTMHVLGMLCTHVFMSHIFCDSDSHLPIFLILILASAGISSGSSSSSLKTDATVGFFGTAFTGAPMLILMGALGLENPMDILEIRGGGGAAGSSSSELSQLSQYVALLSLSSGS